METEYNYFRDYDPAIGRYLQADPLGVIGLAKLFLPTPMGTGDAWAAETSPEISALNMIDSPQPEMATGDSAPMAGLSLFFYVGGRPLSLIDPLGLVASKPGFGACLKKCNADKDFRFILCRMCGPLVRICIAWANAKHALCKADCTARFYPNPPKQDPKK